MPPVETEPKPKTAGAAAPAAGAQPEAAAKPGTAAPKETTATDPAAAEDPATDAAATESAGEEVASEPGAADGADAAEADAELVVPEGAEMSDDDLAQAKAIGKELGLDAKGTQRLLDTSIQRARQQTAAYVEQVKADPELGGKNFQRTADRCEAFLKEFGTPGLRSIFNRTGLGNHPDVVRAVIRVMDLVVEPERVPKGRVVSDGASKDDGEVFFPGMTDGADERQEA